MCRSNACIPLNALKRAGGDQTRISPGEQILRGDFGGNEPALPAQTSTIHGPFARRGERGHFGFECRRAKSDRGDAMVIRVNK